MRFHFRLHAVLQLRRLREEQERAKLALFQSRQAAVQIEESRINSLRTESMNASYSGSESPLMGGELHFVKKCLDTLKIVSLGATQAVAKASRLCNEQEEIYRRTRQESEVLEVLREEQFGEFQLLEKRNEQKQMDEVHSLTRSGKPRQALPTNSAVLAQSLRFPRDEPSL
jgi:flagellar export protein FliJ